MSFAGSVGAMERLDAPEYRDMWARLLAQLIGADETQGGARSHHAASDDQALAKRTVERNGEAVRRQQHSDARRDSGASQTEDAAFEAFFQRHEQPLYGYLRRMLPTHEIAVEVAQEAFFRAWTHFEEVRAYERPEA
ncbi:MAG TPA: sigma factor, partial [Ktedonobacterales bacterium]|nr:sigma factor [Ktedonobacterales bacterium]